jgi:hypothetical protein
MELMMVPRENPREKWTDERLDDLNKKVDDGFSEMREEFRGLRSELGAADRSIRGEIGAMRGELGVTDRSIRGELAAMNRHFTYLFVTMTIGFISTIATVLATS